MVGAPPTSPSHARAPCIGWSAVMPRECLRWGNAGEVCGDAFGGVEEGVCGDAFGGAEEGVGGDASGGAEESMCGDDDAFGGADEALFIGGAEEGFSLLVRVSTVMLLAYLSCRSPCTVTFVTTRGGE